MRLRRVGLAYRISELFRHEPTAMNTHAIEWVLLDHDAPDGVAIGDVVSADAGGLPTYRVVAITGDEAWLHDERHASEYRLPRRRLRG